MNSHETTDPEESRPDHGGRRSGGPRRPRRSNPSSAPRAPHKKSPDDGNPPSGLALVIESECLGICRLPPKTRLPIWVHRSQFFTVSRSPTELSIVCEEKMVPKSIRCEAGWRAIRVKEPLDLSLIGVLASLASPLADAGVSIFAISTFDTDYLLVRGQKLSLAKRVLEEAGHRFNDTPAAAEASTGKAAKTASPQTSSDKPAKKSPEAPPEKPVERLRRRRSARASEDAAQTASADAKAPAKKPVAKSARRDPEVKAAKKRAPKAEVPKDGAPKPEAKPVATEATKEFRQDSTRRKSLRSDERRQRLSKTLQQFGATLTNDPRFGTSDEGKKSDANEEPAAAGEMDLDWEAALQSDDAGADDGKVSADDGKTKPSPKAPPESKPSKVHSFKGESLTSRSEDVDDDEPVNADGLFTGAIPQGDVEVTDQSFATLGLSDIILDAIREMGFEHPTPIQAAVVPEALEGVDIIGLAETGSGKTAAFVLPLAERLYHGKGIRGLIICPTREIALQTKAFIDVFGRSHKLKAVAIIGGVKMGPQIDGLRANPDILVATPGRLADHLRRGNVTLKNLEELVIDEADHMLDLGFLPQIKEILEQAPRKRRSMMFSATMLPAIERLAQQFMNDPLLIDIRPVNQVAEGIEHRLYLVHDADLKTCLLRLLDEFSGSTLIFARRKLHTEWLARQLQQAGCPADRIHSDRTQAQRVRALRGFREGKFRILVATDVAARGIDVPRIQHVINYGMPESVQDYVHRAGRTARGNSDGVVSSLGTWQDKPMVREIESVLGVEMPRCTVEGVEPYVERRPRRKTVRRRRLL